MAKQKQSLTSNQSSWFDSLSGWKKDLLCIGLLYLIILIVFNKIVFDDMLFADSGDTAAHLAWVKASEYLQQRDGEIPLWIPYIFSGLPITASFIFPHDVNYLGRILLLVGKVIFLNASLSWFIMHFFLCGVFMYLLVRYLKFSQLPALIAALTYMLNPYAIGLGQVGHGGKLITLSYIPLLFMAAHYVFEKRNVLGVGFLAVTAGLLFLGKHPQIAFYGLLIVGLYTLFEIVQDVKQQPMLVAKKIFLLALALGIGIGIYAYEFLPVQEYSQYSIRGSGGEGAGTALSYEYATNWSFHPFEMMNYFIPSFFGYASPYYWGWMPFTDSTVYIGMVPTILGILALVYRRNRMTWFLAITSALMVLISFGKHFGIVYNLMFDYVPYFNKFRVPVMILHLMPFTFGLLAVYGYSVIVETLSKTDGLNSEVLAKKLTKILIALAVIFVLALIGEGVLKDFLSSFMFQKEGELQELRQQYGAQAGQALEHLRQTRFELFWKDLIKFCLLSSSVIGVIVMSLKRKMKPLFLPLALLSILVIDLSIINVRYIQPVPQKNLDMRFTADETIQALQSESEENFFRVYPAGSLFQDNYLMYHHIPSVGGYSPAKIKIYQEVIDSCFRRGNMNVFNMLNTKYILVERESEAGRKMVVQENPGALPRAWFVDSIIVSETKSAVFQILNSPAFEPRHVAILEQPPSTPIQKSDSTFVALTSYRANAVTIRTYSTHSSLLVLSEIYYPVGWKAFVDGNETEIYKTNYILRSVIVPAGTHTIEFRFEPKSYERGYLVSNISWAAAVVLLFIGIWREGFLLRSFSKYRVSASSQ